MSPIVIYCLLIGVGLLLWVVALELSDGKERLRRSLDLCEMDDLFAARDVTGHVE